MPTKAERAQEAAQHASLVRGVFAEDTERAVEGAVIYEDGEGRDLELPEPRFEETKATIAWASLAEVVEKAHGRVCVLDPANFTRPAGGYLAGIWDPESQLCAESNLFPVLEKMRSKYHKPNRTYVHGGLYSDRAVYFKDVVFTTGGVMRKRDILAIAPPNRKMALENHRSENECATDLANRIESLMRIAAANEIDTLVLCAFGCGWAGNKDSEVARLFKEWLDAHPGHFDKVVFAIAGGPALDAFRKVFPVEERHHVDVEENAASEEVREVSDDFETDVEPVSDGRWVFE